MSESARILNEQQAAAAFDKQSALFDGIYSENTIIQYKRDRVIAHTEQFINPGSKILELNSGTGEDAIYFASEGHYVHATDISEGMQQILARKIISGDPGQKITLELCSFTDLENIQNKGPYDLIFSNFAGLNCTGALDKVLHSFSALLKPGGIATLVILPEFCLWETLLLFKGKFKTAFRRFFSRKGTKAHIEGKFFTCWYYNPSYIKKHLPGFNTLSIEGLCVFVPPSYIEGFAEKYPKSFSFLKKLEYKLKTSRFWRSVGDYYIITLRKK
ncbi:MAG TPA: class I SAM-dependent methyltransferase [Chitinophagaceae bacterium]|nr:class I SAM-dependent methyltransferase [Chitinophagaceae bacterium]